MPGTGKSFGVDDLIAKMLLKHHKEYIKDAVVINTTPETAENLAKALKINKFYTIEEFLNQVMTNHTEVGLNADGELDAKEGVHYKVVSGTQIDAIAEPKEGLVLPQVIFVDELPTLNRIQILELAKLAKKYNIEILATGDYNQTTPNGIIQIGEHKRALTVSRSKYFPSTKLGVSMRTDNNQKTNNINQAQIAVDTAQYEPDEDIDLTLTYMQDEQGIFGDKVVFTSGTDITDAQLQAILEDIDIMIATLKKDKKGETQKINYIFSNPNSKLYKKLSQDNKYKEHIQFHAGNSSQGKEGQYWIVENNREVSSLSTYLQELYTGISRSEQGSIIIASSNYSGNLAKLTLKNTQTNVRINEGFSEEIKQKQLEKLIKFYGALTLNETPVTIVRNKPVSLKSSLVEEIRKAEADASLEGDPIYFSIISEDPLKIKVGDQEIDISKEDLINKIKTENYRLVENPTTDDSNPTDGDIIDDESNKKTTDTLNDELSKKQRESLQRIESQESQPVINFYQYMYSAFSMETSVEVDDSGNIVLTDSKQLSTDPTDSRIDNIIGLYKYFNGTLDYHTLHQKLNQLRLAFLTNPDKTSLQIVVMDVLGISEEQAKDLYIVFGYKKTNATVKDDGNREQVDVYTKANKTNKEIIEYNAQGGSRSNEVGVNNLVVNIGFEESGDFLEIPLMRFASPISIMYQTDKDGKYLFQELIDFWNSEELKNDSTFIKCKKLIAKFQADKKYERIIREFKFYVLPNSNYFSISALDQDWLPASHLTNLGPQVITNAGTEFYNETGFEFSNDDDNSWIGISQFRDAYKEVMQISRVRMLTSEKIQGVDITDHINVGFPFILVKMGQAYDLDLMSDDLLEEFISDIKAGRPSKIRVVYLAKPKIALDSYLKKVYSFIFNKGKKTEFGNIFTTYKILEALFRNFDENSDILIPNSKRTKIVKDLIDKVSAIKSDKDASYTKEEIEQIVTLLKDTFSAVSRDAELVLEGSEISVKTLFDSFLANLLKTSDTDTNIDESKLKTITERVLKGNPSLQHIYADGIKFKTDDGVATLEDSYLLESSDSGLNSEEFFIHAKVTLPMFFNEGIDFVQKFMDEFVGNRKYSKHNFNYFGVTTKKNASGKPTVVKTGKYKYGKSKIKSNSDPGVEVRIPSIDEINTSIDQAFDEFANSSKNVNNAKSLFSKISKVLKLAKESYADFDINPILNRIRDTLLTNGILIHVSKDNSIKYYNLKTRPYNLKGDFVTYKVDEGSGNTVLIFKLGDTLMEYQFTISEDGTLDLYQISDHVTPKVLDVDYKTKFDELIRSDEFGSILRYDQVLQALFNKKLAFTNFSESLYDVLAKLPEIQRNSYLKAIKNAINKSDASDSFKEQASILDNFITPPKC